MSMEHGSVSSDEEDMEAIELHRRLAADEDDELDLSTTAASEPAAAVPSTALARAVNEAASEGRTADALALIAEELSSVREDQRALVSLVHESFARTDAALAALAERLGSPGIVAHSPRASASAVAPPPPLSGPRSGTPSSGASRAEASPGSRFAARLGISTSLYDDAPRIPVHIWTGTWNVGASEPVGGAKGCTEADLQAFAPRGFDVYALAVQEAMTDRVFDAFAAATGSVRIPMLPITHATRAATAETGGATSAADSLGHGGTGSSMATSHGPMLAPPLGSAGSAFGSASERRESSATTTAATHAGLDRVLGRGDGSLVSLKFTGLALFVSEAMLPHFRLLRVDRLSFGTTEGSKGAVAAVVRIHGSTVTIVSCHLASKRIDMRFDQYCDVCKTLGAKVGNEYFQLNEQSHHVIFMGDFNYRCEGISGDEALALTRADTVHRVLLASHDSMRKHMRESGAWAGYAEPRMAPDLWPTYKKVERRPPTDTGRVGWAADVYRIHFREPLYKGGRVMDRVPGWCDRIIFHSLPHLRWSLFPLSQREASHCAARSAEVLHSLGSAAGHGWTSSPPWARDGAVPSWACDVLDSDDAAADAAVDEEATSSYRSDNDRLVCSDHSPVSCVFRLLAVPPPQPPGAGASPRSRGPSSAHAGDSSSSSSSSSSAAAAASGLLMSASGSSAPPPPGGESLGMMTNPRRMRLAATALIRVQRIEVVQGEGGVLIPSVAKVLCPAPFELDDSPPMEVRVTKTKQGLSAMLTLTVADPAVLPRLHLLLKVQLDRSSKGHCVVSLRPLVAAIDGHGESSHTYFAPLSCDGVPRKDSAGRAIHVQFQAALQVRALG